MAQVSIADQLKVLLEIQKLDSELYQLESELKTKPVQAEQLKQEQKQTQETT